MSNVFLHG
ncbi:hypothetical protein Pint_25812 [Pistacia integerrima]|uniref:Uncharacterized protein n=1 Tax=Pistacia integerrima TaxID=434235 RepID=A0ACC0YH64_9ROSI|nr:hypothetical protein Pint_25812 [Pistacia integerrima]